MSHLHIVHDSDAIFTIDPVTRIIKNESGKTTVIQGDHNSERFTFSIQKQVDGHDMSICNRIEIHYINIDATDKTKKATGMYEADDLQTSSDVSGKVTFSWLLSRNATRYAGSLSFLIRFACIMEGVEEYAWNTAIFQGITVGSGMYNGGEEVIEPYLDVIAQWKTQLFEASDTAVLNVTTAETNALAAIEAAGEAKKQSVLNSIPDEYEVLQMGVDTLFNSVASGIRVNMSGTVVAADDVSPVEHHPAIRIHGKNLIPFPYAEETTTKDGITFSVNADGGITVSGTATVNTSFNLTMQYQKKLFVKKGREYTISCVSSLTAATGYVYFQIWANGIGNDSLSVRRGSLAFTASKDGYVQIGLVLLKGQTFNETVYIQLEEGTTATEYTPYIDPATVKVNRCGKNFWHSRDLSYPRTVSGVTINYDPDSQIYTFNGTSTSPGDIYTIPNGADIMHINAGETWTLKVEVMGGTIDGVATSSGKMSPLVNTNGYTNTIHANAESLYATKTYTEAADITKMYFYVYASGIVFNNFKCRIQFEQNSKPTEFEKFKNLAEYIPTADGTVCGVTSLSPNMTILTDTEGVIVECEYIIDTKTYIDKKITEALKGSEQA